MILGLRAGALGAFANVLVARAAVNQLRPLRAGPSGCRGGRPPHGIPSPVTWQVASDSLDRMYTFNYEGWDRQSNKLNRYINGIAIYPVSCSALRPMRKRVDRAAAFGDDPRTWRRIGRAGSRSGPHARRPVVRCGRFAGVGCACAGPHLAGICPKPISALHRRVPRGVGLLSQGNPRRPGHGPSRPHMPMRNLGRP